MKTKTVFTLSGLFIAYVITVAAGISSSEEIKSPHHSLILNSSGSPAGRTGAPGEQLCTGCHAGTAQSGAGVNTLTFDSGNTEYTPGNSYQFDISMNTGTSKNGFQVTALDGSNNMAGGWTITNAGATQTVSGLGRSYVTHTFGGNNQSSWSMQWDAPASDVGDVTFYVSTNATNNNGNGSGDVIYISQLTISSATSTGISIRDEMQASLSARPDGDGNLWVLFNTIEPADCSIKVFDLKGRQILDDPIGAVGSGQQEVFLSGIPAGAYLLNVFVDNHVLIDKVVLP